MTEHILAFQFIGVEMPVVGKFVTRHEAEQTGNGWYFPGDVEALASEVIRAPTSGLVALYNKLNPENPIKKFRDRATAAQRVWDSAESLVPLHKETKMDNTQENLSQKLANATAEQAAAREAAKAEKAKLAEEKKQAAEAKKAEREAAREQKNKDREAAKAAREEERARKKAEREAARAEKGEGRRVRHSGATLTLSEKAYNADGVPMNTRREGSFGHKSLQIIIDAGEGGILYEDFIKAGGRSNDLNWDIDHGTVVSTPAIAA